MVCLLVVSSALGIVMSGNNGDKDTSKFTANIDKYWRDNNIDELIEKFKCTEKDLAKKKAEMLAIYGENKEITCKYDEDLAAKTATGIYFGRKNADNVVSWKGIPYAKQPIGELRWRAPQALDKSNKVFEAYYFGHSSLQKEGNDEQGSLYPQGEDCLNLNVWNNISDKTENKPIMVWIHGGAYIQGSSCDPLYDGTDFVKNNPDVIYISFDYRTDFVGFINLSKVPGADDYKDTANLGLMDGIQALAWLKENASAFGGDPKRITIFGESAGAGSVSALTIAPQAKGLFERAIMQSGTALSYLRSEQKSLEHTDMIMDICGAKTIDDLKSLTSKDLKKIETIIWLKFPNQYTYPQSDGIVIPLSIKSALDSDQRNGIDILIGTTKDEYNYWTSVLGKDVNMKFMKISYENFLKKLNEAQRVRVETFMSSLEKQGLSEYDRLIQFVNYFVFHSPAIYEAESHTANGQNTYGYYFVEESTDKDLLAHHAFDLPFIFGNIDESAVKDVPAAHRLCRIMQRMWVNFAKTGNPSLGPGEVDGVGEIRWNKYEPSDYPVMIFDAQNTRQESNPAKEGSDLFKDMIWYVE